MWKVMIIVKQHRTQEPFAVNQDEDLSQEWHAVAQEDRHGSILVKGVHQCGDKGVSNTLSRRIGRGDSGQDLDECLVCWTYVKG